VQEKKETKPMKTHCASEERYRSLLDMAGTVILALSSDGHIQIRLMIASVDKAKEMGLDWGAHNPEFSSKANGQQRDAEIAELRQSVARLEACLARSGTPHAG
jgi:hypothetical protein